MSKLKDLTKAIKEGGKVADNLTESSEERQQQISDRHLADMSSDNALAKSIRPVTLLWLLVLETLIVVMSAFDKTVDMAITIQVGTLLGGAFSFYFNSRKTEKVAAQNAKANVQLEKIKTRHANKVERKQIKQERKNARRAERKQDKED